MTFWGFAMNYMFRMNINIAIVSMVKHSIKNVTVESECPDAYVVSPKLNNTYGQKSPANTDVNPIRIFYSFVSFLIFFLRMLLLKHPYDRYPTVF